MISCTNCGSQMTTDPTNSDRMICQHCGYVLEGGTGDYWGSRGVGAQAQETSQSPQPTVQPTMTMDPSPSNAPNGGAYQQPPYGTDPSMGMVQPPVNLPKGLAIAALVLGILALLDCFIPVANIVAIIMGILALIFGILGISRANKGMAGGKGLAIGGVATGAIAIVVALIVNIAFGVLFNAVLQDDDVQSAIEEIMDEELYDDDSYLYHNEDEGDDSSIPTVAADDSAAWTAMEFTMGTNSFKLMETTLEDLVAKTGWNIDLESDGYTNSSMIDPQGSYDDDLVLVELQDPADSHNSLWVLLANPTEAPLNIMKCVLSSVDADPYRSTFDFKVCGVGLGNTIDEVIAALGNPQDTYESSDDYVTLSYETKDYSKVLEFIAIDGKNVDEVELTVNRF